MDIEYPGSKLPSLLQAVIDGVKPGSCIEKWEIDLADLTRIAEEHNLEVINIDDDETNKWMRPCYVCARRGQCDEIFKAIPLPQIPVLRERVEELLKAIDGLSIAQALHYLVVMPKTDPDYPIVESTINIERPEAALIEGILLGFKPCCVDYFIKTRYLDEPRDPTAENCPSNPDDPIHLISCPGCAANKPTDGKKYRSPEPVNLSFLFQK